MHSNILTQLHLPRRDKRKKRWGKKEQNKSWEKTKNKSKAKDNEEENKREGGERWVVYVLLKERSAVAGRHSLICHYSHQAPGTATLKLCVRVCVCL